MRLVRAVLSDGHTGANVHEITLINETQVFDPSKHQLLYIELADLPFGAHQLVVGEYSNPLSLCDFTSLPALRGKFITHSPIFDHSEGATNPRFVMGQAHIPIYVDEVLVGQAILFLRH